MNIVLFLMYAADLASGISVVTALVGIVMLCVWTVRWLAISLDALDGPRPAGRKLYPVVILFAICAVMPSKSTIYAVAAVQAGEVFADTERGAKVLSALDAWLEKQTEG